MKNKHLLIFGCAAAGILFIMAMYASYCGAMMYRGIFGPGQPDTAAPFLAKAFAAGIVVKYMFYLAVMEMAIAFLGRALLRRKNKKYERLGRYVDAYLQKYGEDAVTDESKAWIKKMMNRASLIVCAMYVWLLAVAAAAECFIMETGAADLLNVILVPLLAAPLAVILKHRITMRRKVAELIETKNRPLDAMWCQYKKHDPQEIPSRWSVTDMDIAVCMNRMQDCQESMELAEEIWKCFGRDRKKGVYYMQYHFLQWRNCLAMGMEEEAQQHRQCVDKEMERSPRSKYNERVRKRIEEIENTDQEK